MGASALDSDADAGSDLTLGLDVCSNRISPPALPQYILLKQIGHCSQSIHFEGCSVLPILHTIKGEFFSPTAVVEARVFHVCEL